MQPLEKKPRAPVPVTIRFVDPRMEEFLSPIELDDRTQVILARIPGCHYGRLLRKACLWGSREIEYNEGS